MKRDLSLVSLLGKRPQRDRLPQLGERELGVLEVLWQDGPLTSQAVLERIGADDLSLSTVQSTLERLHRKSLLQRSKDGRSFVYSALMSKQNLISRLMHDIADSLTDGETAPMVSGFLDYLGDDPREGRSGTSAEAGVDISRGKNRRRIK